MGRRGRGHSSGHAETLCKPRTEASETKPVDILVWDFYLPELWVPWTAKSSNQSILKEISPQYSVKGLILKLKLQYFGHLMRGNDSLEKTLMLGLKSGGEGDDRGWDGWMASPTQWIWVWASSGSWWWTGRPGMLQSMGLLTVGHDWESEMNWTELIYTVCDILLRQP